MSQKPGFQAGLQHEDDHRAVIWNLRGRLIGDPLCYEFLESVRAEIDAGRPNVVLDLGGVDQINSTGLGILASIYISSHNHGGRVCLVGVSGRTEQLLDATGLRNFMPLCDSVDEALNRHS
ncbi:MAG: STAS domain-containing protein [Candidatus Krumholzibacteriia bacterium]